jgi:PAS domain S-box-containing protein
MNPMKTSSPLRILLVDDDENDRLAFRRALQKSHVVCEVTECVRAEEALERLRADASLFDVVVIDHVLPGVSGLELSKELLDEKTPLPLVILTGRGSEQLAVEALKAGVDDYIVKDFGQSYLDLLPVVLSDVVRKHGDHIARRRAEEALRKAHNELEQRVEERTAKLARTTEQLKQELTERKRAEEALVESEERYRVLFDHDPNSIFVLDQNTFRILDVNQQALEVYGYEKHELIGKPFMDLGRAEYPEGVLSTTKPTLSTQSSVYSKVQHRRKDNKSLYVNIYARRGKWSRKYGIIATTADITESMVKETELIQASKMSTLGEMATGMAHELNQPLSTIEVGTQFIRDSVKQGQQISEADLVLVSEQMAQQVARASRIIDHLREFGRKADLQREKVDINQPLKGVFTVLGQQLKVRGIEVIHDLKEDLPPIIGDNIRLEQVIVDLVINARDAMEEKRKQYAGGHIDNTLTIRSLQENDQVVVTLTDTGTGIADDIRDKIFEPFFTTKKVGEGTGLGLSIAYGIVRDYGGSIQVESQVGKGTTFKISFPACEEDKNGVCTNEPPRGKPRGIFQKVFFTFERSKLRGIRP